MPNNNSDTTNDKLDTSVQKVLQSGAADLIKRNEPYFAQYRTVGDMLNAFDDAMRIGVAAIREFGITEASAFPQRMAALKEQKSKDDKMLEARKDALFDAAEQIKKLKENNGRLEEELRENREQERYYEENIAKMGGYIERMRGSLKERIAMPRKEPAWLSDIYFLVPPEGEDDDE